MLSPQKNHPTTFVIFGGTGDLATTKLFPALFDLFIQDKLPNSFTIIGLSRKDLSDADYQAYVIESIAAKGHGHSTETVTRFAKRCRYVVGDFDEAAAYERVTTAIAASDTSIGQCTNKLFYLAVPPQYYEIIFHNLHLHQVMALCDGIDSWSRLLVEKPFGRDLQTALALEEKLTSLFTDEQIYRIDHYLAKDAIENIIALRFANTVLAQAWHGDAIESVAINLFETKDVSNRGAFYDAIGTLRDVGQNHLLQLFALLTMAPTDVRDGQAVRQARALALESLHTYNLEQIVRGQYDGFEEEKGVECGSQTETYFSVNFTGTMAPWSGTTFTLTAGKALDHQTNEVIVTFRPTNLCYCGGDSGGHEHRNVLHIILSPQQEISLTIWTKQPGFDFSMHQQTLVLATSDSEPMYSPEAYERVLFDCIVGDQTRFVSGREVEAAWRFITPILNQFPELPLLVYEKGSAGPAQNVS